jgi:hypothetical protein
LNTILAPCSADAEADAGRGTGDEGGLALQDGGAHDVSFFYMDGMVCPVLRPDLVEF